MLTPSPCGQRCASPTRAHDHRDHDRICRRFWTQLVEARPDRACGQAGGDGPRMPGGQAKEIRAPGAAGGIHRPRDGPRKPPHAAVQTGPVGPRIGAVGARHVVAASGRQTPGFAGGQIGTGAGASRTPTWTLLGRRPRMRDRQAMTLPACAALDGDPGVRGGRPNGCAGRATVRQGNRRMRLFRPAPDAMLHRAWPHHASVVA